MNKKELIKALFNIPGNPEITILDGSNGGGIPRAINFGPLLNNIKDRDNQTEDIKTQKGNIIIMGYGCY